MLTKNLIYETNSLYKKILGFLIKKGNKSKAKYILDNTFFLISKRTGFSMHICLLKLFLSLNTFVEVKKIRAGRRFLLVPFSISLKRRSYLIVKWLMQSVSEDRKKLSLSTKLADEILLTINSAVSKSKRLRNINIYQALSNRSNIHYRW